MKIWLRKITKIHLVSVFVQRKWIKLTRLTRLQDKTKFYVLQLLNEIYHMDAKLQT